MFQEKNGIVTPEKKEGNSVGMDTTEKEHLRIEELKRKILMMSKEHELELEGYRVEIGSLQHEAERAKRL